MKQIFPEEEFDQLSLARKNLVKEISEHVTSIKAMVKDMTLERKYANRIEDIREKAFEYEKKVFPYLEGIREHVDALEMEIDNEIWPLPKYRELLFL